MFARTIGACALVVLLFALGSPNVAAQTLDDVFNDNVIQEIRLTVNASDWQNLRNNYELDIYYPAVFTWRYNGKDIGPSNGDTIEIKSRGTGSRSGIKPSLKLDMNRDDPTQNFLGVSSLILRNNSQDATEGLHERLTMLLARRMGLPVPREAHCRLYVSTDSGKTFPYFGLYTLVEAIDNHFVQLNLGDTGGYLYKYTWVDPAWWFTYLGSNPNTYSANNNRFEPDNDLAKNQPNAAVFEPMFKAINNTSQSDSDYVAAVSQYLDLNAFMAQIAIENFAADNDGLIGDWGCNNFYTYRFAGKNLHRFMLWDKSEAFQSLDFDIARHTDLNVLSKRLWAIPAYRKIYMDTQAKAAAVAGGAGGWMDTESKYEYNQIHADAVADPNYLCKGPDGMPARCTVQQYEDGNKITQQFAADRSANVKNQLQYPPSSVAAGSSSYQAYELRAVNGASFVPNDISPGSLISIFGSGLASSTVQASSTPLPTQLAGVNVKINGIDAPLLYVSPTQVNLQVPYEVPTGSATITATLNGAATLNPAITTAISAVSPGIFAVVDRNYSAITPSNPAKANDVVIVYTNGLGAVNGTAVTGQSNAAAAPTKSAATASVGGFTAQVQYAGLAPGWVGLYQVNVQLPSRVFASDRSVLMLTIGGSIAVPANISTR
jgi:uncharacterized protein (TIGR03437 family)